MANIYVAFSNRSIHELSDEDALRIAQTVAEDEGVRVAMLDEEGWWLVSPQGGEPEYLYGERDERRLLALGIELGEEERAALYVAVRS